MNNKLRSSTREFLLWVGVVATERMGGGRFRSCSDSLQVNQVLASSNVNDMQPQNAGVVGGWKKKRETTRAVNGRWPLPTDRVVVRCEMPTALRCDVRRIYLSRWGERIRVKKMAKPWN